MDVVIASSEADLRAAEAVEAHHAELAGALGLRVATLLAAATDGPGEVAEDARARVVEWSRHELVPHALAEETTLYAAAAVLPGGRLLVEAMLAEHALIVGLVDELAETTAPVAAASVARALRTLFEAHLAKENEQVLPLLLATPGVSVAELLGGMHELLGGAATEPHERGHDHGHEAGHAPGHESGDTCACGETDPASYPELDARAIPHAIRHATIFGALDAVAPGEGLVLLAPHDPLPLLSQLEQRDPEAFSVDYVESGPDSWRLLLRRRAGRRSRQGEPA